MPNHAYCEICDAVHPVTVEPLQELDSTGRYRGGDMVCAVCGFIARTVYETMLEEMLQQLRDKGADARRLDEYIEVWTVAINHDGERVPCPTCFAGYEIGRLTPLPTQNGVGRVRCERCHTLFTFDVPG